MVGEQNINTTAYKNNNTNTNIDGVEKAYGCPCSGVGGTHAEALWQTLELEAEEI